MYINFQFSGAFGRPVEYIFCRTMTKRQQSKHRVVEGRELLLKISWSDAPAHLSLCDRDATPCFCYCLFVHSIPTYHIPSLSKLSNHSLTNIRHYSRCNSRRQYESYSSAQSGQIDMGLLVELEGDRESREMLGNVYAHCCESD